jgi:hypothetical protein
MIARMGLAFAVLAAAAAPAAADMELGGAAFSQRMAGEVIQRRIQVCAALSGTAYQRDLPRSPPVGTGWPVTTASRLCRR